MEEQEAAESLKRGQDYVDSLERGPGSAHMERQKRLRDDLLDGTKGVLMSTEGQCIVVGSVACVCLRPTCM
jgi:hypothetical protein